MRYLQEFDACFKMRQSCFRNSIILSAIDSYPNQRRYDTYVLDRACCFGSSESALGLQTFCQFKRTLIQFDFCLNADKENLETFRGKAEWLTLLRMFSVCRKLTNP